jgi:hypothetical protein
VTADNETKWTDAAPQDRRAFSASEMIECSGCSRANPPTRANCLYCGAALENAAGANFMQLTPTVAAPEQGSLFHVVIVTPIPLESALAELATISSLTPMELDLVFSSSNNGTPFCAVDNSSQAELIRERLRGLDVKALVITDDQLNLNVAPKDVRALEFTEHSLVAIYRRGDEKISVAWNDVTLIVAGRLHATTVEIEQKRSRRRGRTLAEREFSTDEAMLDLYVLNDGVGWRIRNASFDFSCLENEKSLTAFQNFATLTSVLRRRAADVEFDESYNRLRPILARMWPVKEPEGKRERRRTASREFEATITSSDNLAEFTRYSRLRRFLKSREPADTV